MTNRFRSLRETVEYVNEAGVSIKLRGVQGWIARYPDIAWKIAGRQHIPDAATNLILAGVPLADVAARMRAWRQGQAE